MTQSSKAIKGGAITDVISTTLSDITSNISSIQTTVASSTAPKISSITYVGNDTAADVAGGQTITLTGSGFASGATVLINNQVVSVVTVVSSTSITFTSPALAAGSYIVYVVNTDGGTAIAVPGIQYSGTPAWTTAAGTLGSQYETTTFNKTVAATGDAPVTYSLVSGSLPTGATLNSNGTITGTSVVGSGSPTTYTFTVAASDAQNQDTNRQFSITINPDLITWSSPANATVISSYEYSNIPNVTLSATSGAGSTVDYTASGLPAGITISGSTISGSSSIVANTAATITATGNATTRTASETIYFNVQQDSVTWNNPATDNSNVTLDTSVYSSTLSATSAAGKTISYTANSLPAGITLSNGVISGTPTVEGNSATLLTATAATTNRSATRTINWTVMLSDAYWKYTSLFLTANAVGQTSSFASDTSINNAQLTVFGDTKPQNFNPYQFGYYSAYFGANGQYLTGSHSWLNITSTTRAWTFECWIYPITGGYFFAIGSGTSYGNSLAVDWGLGTTNKFRFMQGDGGSSNPVSVTTTNTYPPNTWYHVAVTRTTAGVMTMYINGVVDGTVTYNAAAVSTGTTFVVNGAYDNNGIGNNGSIKFISNLRFTLDRVVYSSAFTPSTAPLAHAQGTLLLLCQSNRFVESSQFNHPVTIGSTPTISQNNPFTTQYQAATTASTYSYYFNGSSYLTIPVSTNLELGMTWTVECWIYPLSSAKQHIFNVGGTTLYIEGLSGLRLSKWSNGSNSGNYGGYLVQNAWNHVSWQCNTDGVVRGFINGLSAIVSSGYAINTSSTACIGSAAGTNSYTGYISNLRVLKGTALYATSGYNPPTEPLTAITNTVLLTCQSSTIVDNSSSAFTMTPTGTVTPMQFYPSVYSGVSATALSTTLGSALFDGTGDYLTVPAGAALEFGSGDFTIELWWFPTSTARQALYHGSFGADWSVGIDYNGTGANKIGIWASTNGTSWNLINSDAGGNGIGTITPTQYAWNHIAYVRSGTTWMSFVNGIKDITLTALSGTIPDRSTYPKAVGQWWSTSSVNPVYGSISNFRITKSALYTTNFVPGYVTPLTKTSTTQLLTLQSNASHNNSTFTDVSRSNIMLTRNGNTSMGTFSPFGDNWSYYVGGTTSDYIDLTGVATLGTGDFTLECWVFMDASASQYDGYTGFISTAPSGSGSIGIVMCRDYFWVGNGTSSPTISSSAAMVYNQWMHVALTRSGTTVRGFVNGTVLGTTQTSSQDINSTSGRIGSRYTDSMTYGAFKGFISNLRIVKGTALYTSSFTVGTTPLVPISGTTLLTANNNRYTDMSLTNTTMAKTGTVSVQKFSPFGTMSVPKYYSGYFNGSTDYLTVGTSAISLPTSTTPFTIEAWVYVTAFTGVSIMATNFSSGGIPFWLGMNTGNNSLVGSGGYPVMGFYSGSAWTYAVAATPANSTQLSLNTWYHIAGVYTGSSATIYVNGNQHVTASISSWQTTASSAGGINIGRKWDSSSGAYFSGYISNARLVIGSALYTTNFTPSTTPLTAVANTTFLTCQDNTFKDNSTNNYPVIAGAATAKPLPVSPFTPTVNATPISYTPSIHGSSMYFDGTGDYLTALNSRAFDLSAGQWTIECWFYQTASKQVQLFSLSAAQWRLDVGTNQGGSFVFNTTSVGSFPAGSFPLNQWNHIAVSHNNDGTTTAVKQFANGKLVFTGQYIPGLDTTSLFYIGNNKDASGAWDFNGYMTDVRITKGQCLYTSSFYPPTSPATVTQNTSFLANGSLNGIVDQTRTVDLETVGDAKVTQFSPYNGSYYSINLPDTSSYLSFSQPALGNLFTIEMWVFPTATQSNQYIYVGGSTSGPLIGYNSSTFSVAHQGGWSLTASTNPTVGAWNHIAIVRAGTGANQFKAYLNGTLVATGTDSTTFGAQTGTIGASGSSFVGYISNLRIVNNQALYTGSFTPSTSPLTISSVGSTGAGAAASISGTVALLTCQSNKFIDNSASALTLTASGTPKVQTQNPFQVNTGQSYYFDGTGDYLTVPASTNNALGADFTVECWAYQTGTQTTTYGWGIVGTYDGGSNGGWSITINRSTGGYGIGFVHANAWQATYNTYLPVNVWNHIAVSRSGSSLRIFLNGALVASAAYATVDTVNAINYIGSQGTGQLFNGYITDLRISKYARYTTAFTPLTLPYKTN